MLNTDRLGKTSHVHLAEAMARNLILLAAGISFALSVTLYFSGHEHQGMFVGLWVPSILSLGAIVLRRDHR